MIRRILIYSLLMVIALTSCNEDAVGGFKVKPSALGVRNEIVVIADEELWESDTRDSFEFFFESAYPIMPRPESMFDLRHFTPNELDQAPLRKELRSYVLLVDLSATDSRTVEMVRTDLGEEKYRKALSGESTSMIVKDKWARGQLVIYLMGKDRRSLHETIRKSYPAVSRRVNLHDEEQLKAKVYAAGSNPGMSDRVTQRFGINLDIPRKYEIALDKEEENFLWLRKRTSETDMSLVFRTYPYTDSEQLSKENIIKIRNDFGKYVSSTEEGSFMVINQDDLPVYKYTYEIDGNFTSEIRGIWEMTGDYVGGPFISFLILDKEKNKLVFVDSFVYAPGKSKRNMMQELEYIVKQGSFVQPID